MRVLLLSWEFPPGATGGTASHVDGLADALSAAGHDVVVITRSSDNTTTSGHAARVVRVDTGLPWLAADEIASVASGNHALVRAALALDWVPDVVHAHDWQVAWAAEIVADHRHAPLVTTFHGIERSRHGGHLPPGTATDVNAIEWWLSWRSHAVIAPTHLLARQIISGFELEPSIVEPIPTAIDPRWWTSVDDDELATREPLVFSWGHVRYEKGFQVLAHAMVQVRQHRDDVRCVIAGRGSYLPELQSQIDIAGVGDLIELPGYLSDQELREALHRAGCVVIPSLYEPFGVVVLEALASGCPLVVADTGGLAERVAGSDAVLRFEPGNAAELADCICRVLDDPELAEAMAQGGRDLVASSFSWRAVAEHTSDVYERARAALDPISSR